MTQSGGSPRDLTPPQITQLREFFSDHDIGLWHFNREIFGFRDLKWDFHGPICQFAGHWGESHLTSGEVIDTPPVGEDVALSFRRLMIRIPREFFKTSCFTRGLALWTLATKDHDATIGIFNEKEDNPESWIAAICQVVENSILFQVLWREMIPKGIGFWDRDRGVSPGKKLKWGGTGVLFERGTHGVSELSLEPHGVGGAATGKHFTHKILDDIIGLKAKDSPAVMEAAMEWVDHARALERPLEGGCEIVNHTTWTHADVYSHIERKWPGEYLVYCRSLLENPETAEPDDVAGVSTFPEKIPTKKAYQMRDADPYVFACLPADAPILLDDWSEAPISMLEVGQKVTGFVIGTERAQYGRTSIEPAVVQAVVRREREVYEYTLEDGSTICCTPDHKWFVGTVGLRQGRQPYSPISAYVRFSRTNPAQGRIVRLRDPVPDLSSLSRAQLIASGYLAAIFDGEGHVSRDGKKVVVASQCPVKNPEVCERIRESLKLLDIEWFESNGGLGKSGPMINFTLRGVQNRYRFWKLCRPARKRDILLGSLNTYYKTKQLRVVEEKSLGVQTVYAVQTSTGNYIANLCMSANSQYQCQPKAGRDQSFDESWDGHFHLIHMGEEPAILIDHTGGHDSFQPHIFDLDCGEEFAPQVVPLIQCEKAIILDPAPSKQAEVRRDPKARNGIVVVAVDPWGRRFCLESIPSRDGPTEILELLISLYRKWAGRRIAIEEVNFSALYQPLWTRILELDPRYQDVRPEFAATYPRGRDKIQRIRDNLIPVHENFLWYYNTGEAPLDRSSGRLASGPASTRAGPCAYILKEKSEFPYSETVDLLDGLSYTDEVLARPATPAEERRSRSRGRDEYRGVTGYGF
jgi:hypothetical protein